MTSDRLSDRLIAYWNMLRKEEPLPDFSHFNASAIADIWQQCILFVVLPTADGALPMLNFHKVGEKVRPIYGKDMVGQSFNTSQRHFQGAAIVRRAQETMNSPTALTDIGQFINERSKIVKYRSCLLPFGKEGKITHVVVGLSWREF